MPGRFERRLPWITFLVLSIYFLAFAAGALRAKFAPDDMMNLNGYWERGGFQTLRDSLTFWSTAYRPLGGLFYLPLFKLFGLNPAPYRVVILLLMGGNLWLSFGLARLLSRSYIVAALTAIIVCAHAHMEALYYSNSTIYDVLAYLFSLLTLFLYVRIRSSGKRPSVLQGLAIFCLFLAALNAKEVSIVLPVLFVAYELIFAGSPRLDRVYDFVVPSILLLTSLVYSLGKLTGSESLNQVASYRQVFTVKQFVANSCAEWNDLLGANYLNGSRRLLLVWLIGTAICWLVRKPWVTWAWVFVTASALPLAFTERARTGSSLYLPLFGWAFLIAGLLVGSVRNIVAQYAIALMAALAIAFLTARAWHTRAELLIQQQQRTWTVIQAIQDLHVQPRSASSVLFLNDPFDGFDTTFIARLVWRDRSIAILLGNRFPSPPTRAEIERFDWVFDFGETGMSLNTLRSPK